MTQPHVLLCTVGTGNIDQLRETLLEPLKKSIRKGDWKHVVLLPSRLTAENASLLQAEVQDVPIVIRPLPQPGAEDDVDACFAHFDRTIEEQLAAGIAAEALLADFTRGTKAMSAALVLAAIRHDLPQLRYISGSQRDKRGMVVPGTEIVVEVRTTIATARKRLDDAYRFFIHGNFAAVLDILPDAASPLFPVWPDELCRLADFVRPLAAYYAAWDRLDYKGAQRIEMSSGHVGSVRWEALQPTPEVREWVAALAEPLPEEPQPRAARLRLLAADLLANGERRLRHQQFEDAVIRAYRVLELVGQLRLCDQGIHSDDVPPTHPVVQQFQAELARKGGNPLSQDSRGRLLAAREHVARLLKRLGDTLAQRLLDLGNEGVVKAKARNNSALIHGFEAVSGSDPTPLRELYQKLGQLLVDDDPAARERLRLARFLEMT
ncbi:MAG: TIGR02710 family CRISPR-associated CARF protein [Planctomycetota bacterium]|nr:TIGR02710 family CRISPR-associated CARF protein [Planctomycetota bacterium]